MLYICLSDVPNTKASVSQKVSGFLFMFGHSHAGCISCTGRNVRTSAQKQAIEITPVVGASWHCVKAHNQATANIRSVSTTISAERKPCRSGFYSQIELADCSIKAKVTDSRGLQEKSLYGIHFYFKIIHTFTIMDDPKDKKAVVTPLTPVQKQAWNNFQDFMQKQGLAGNPALDDRDKGLGQYWFQHYAAHTPGFPLNYQDVSRVQQELQDYRTNLVNQYKAGKIAPSDDIKSENDIMGNLSPVDSCLGSKTSSSRFPVATATNSQGQTTNYGTDVSAFDKARGLNK